MQHWWFHLLFEQQVGVVLLAGDLLYIFGWLAYATSPTRKRNRAIARKRKARIAQCGPVVPGRNAR